MSRIARLAGPSDRPTDEVLMPDDVVRARRRLVAAVALVATIAIGFGAAFYLLDGASALDDLLAGHWPWDTAEVAETTASVPATVTVDPLGGVPDDFVARVWQEQVDSQDSIGLLLSGDVTALAVGAASIDGDSAALPVTAEFRDGTSADGAITFRRLGGAWFVLGAEGMRAPGAGGMASAVGEADRTSSDSPLPPMSEVDRAIVSTIVSEQRESQSIIEEYLAGQVQRIDITGVSEGPGTRVLMIRMTETHEVSEGEIVCVAATRDDETLWFIARFEKTGSTPK